MEKEYEASASVLFRDSGGGTSVLASTDPQREAETNLRVLQLGVLDDRVDARLAKPFTGHVDVVAEGVSNLATITVTDTDPDRAARVANLYAQQYVALRRKVARQEIRREQVAVIHKIAELPPGSPLVGALKTRRDKLAVAAEAPIGARTLSPAEPPSSPSSPNPVRNTLIGGLIGLALGIGLAIWLERRDSRVRDPRDIEAVFGRPIIGRIPKSKALAKLSPGTGPLPPLEAEAFRTLRANLRHLLRDRNVRSTLVTSANSGDGKTTVAWNLARAEAESGASVLVVEADMRQPNLAKSLGADGASGLSQLLAQDGRLQDLVQTISCGDDGAGNPSLGTVDVLFAGAPPTNPAELLDS